MDTLSLILDDMRMRGNVAYVQLRAPWGLNLGAPGMAVFHIVTSGLVWLVVEGQAPQLLEKGDLIVLPLGTPHKLQDRSIPSAREDEVPPDWLAQPTLKNFEFGGSGAQATLVSGLFRFDVDMAAPLLAALPALMHIRGHNATLAPWLAAGLEFLYIETAQQRPAHQAVINRLLDVLFIEAVRHHVEALPENSDNWLAALRDKALSAVLNEMHRLPAHDWTVQELAGVACLSRSAFAERFSHVMGTPPLGYLTRHRMRLAARHLATSGYSVSRIAEQVGYGSEAAFSQAFKREYGMPPSAWRESKQGHKERRTQAASKPAA